jgi:DNA/RNA-binding domain of Phe-tRNA-synthetase-like protein
VDASLEAGCIQAKKYLPKEKLEENSVMKVWQDAFAKFPHEPNAISSVEVLFAQVLREDEVETVNPLIDICNVISLIWALPITAFDGDRLKGDLHLGSSVGGEEYITETGKILKTQKDEICYFDDAGVVCGAWNWCNAKRTAIDENTKNALLVINLSDPNGIAN